MTEPTIKPRKMQEVFAFAPEHNYDGENFYVAPSNKAAFMAATSFPWASYALHIYGEQGCGKTHIAQIASSIADKPIRVIDNLSADYNQIELLQLLNIAREQANYVLLISKQPLIELGFTLPDLTSRLLAINSIKIDTPSEDLFYLLLARQFSARQINVDDAVLNFLTNNIEHSYASICAVVEKIDRLSLQEKRGVTIPLVKNVIG